MPGYTDPDTGEQLDTEPGLQEGDLILDYAMPLKNLFTAPLTTLGAAASRGVFSRLKSRMPNKAPGEGEAPAIDYTKQGVGFGPTSTKTQATTGFQPGSGYKLNQE